MIMMGTDRAQDLEGAAAKILQRISAEPADRAVLYKILEYCVTARSWADLERTILSFPEMKWAWQSLQTLLSWLMDAGGIEQIFAENGEPMWRTAPAGRDAVSMESCSKRLARLLDREAAYEDIYLQVLQACVSPKSRTEIESMLKGNPALENHEVYASYFIAVLEEAGGLEWDGKWKTTQAGKDFMRERLHA